MSDEFVRPIDKGAAFRSSDTYRQLVDSVNRITQALDADRSTLFLVDHSSNQLVAMVAEGVEEIEIRLNLGEGISGVAAKEGRVINDADAYWDSSFQDRVDIATGYRTKSVLAVPIFQGDDKQVIGVIEVLNKASGPFSYADEEILKVFASILGKVILAKVDF